MAWEVIFEGEFEAEFRVMQEALQDELLAHAKLLQQFGPRLGRPTVDTLAGSKHANMKELRFSWERQVWRIAFCFDPDRRGIVLAGGNKRGRNEKKFYQRLIRTADERYAWHLTARKARGAARNDKERR